MKPVPEGMLVSATPPPGGELGEEYWGPFNALVGPDWRVGFLVLTNRRLIFVEDYGGREPLLSFPLDEIRKVVAEDGLFDSALLVDAVSFDADEEDIEKWGTDLNGIARAVSVARRRSRENPVRGMKAETPPAPQFHERIIIREIVRIPCRFCGNLMDQTALVCPACGARPKG